MNERLRMLIPPLPRDRVRRRESEGERVVLLHGLWRSVWAMEGMADCLSAVGYETVNVPYASFRKSMNEIVEGVADELRGMADGKVVHFVTHSMGGIVVRHLANRYPDLVTGRIVMLAPPNQGSEIIDWLEKIPLSGWVFGEGGMSLSTRAVRENVPGFAEERDVAVVMGRSRAVPFFQSLLGDDNDGIVTVKGGRVEGMSEIKVVDADHTFFMAEEVIREEVLAFLQKEKL